MGLCLGLGARLNLRAASCLCGAAAAPGALTRRLRRSEGVIRLCLFLCVYFVQAPTALKRAGRGSGHPDKKETPSALRAPPPQGRGRRKNEEPPPSAFCRHLPRQDGGGGRWGACWGFCCLHGTGRPSNVDSWAWIHGQPARRSSMNALISK